MKNCFSLLAVLVLMLLLFFPPVKSAGPAIAGHYLTTGQVIVGVTGSAPVANTLLGTSGQIAVSQGAEGGNMQFSFPANVQMQNLTVTGTLSPYSTGTFSTDNLAATYGVAAATGVFSVSVTAPSFGAVSATTLAGSGAITGATTLVIQGATYLGANASATVSTITAAGAATFAASVTAPVVTVSGGAFKPYSRTLAQLNGITPGGAGEMYYCSDCLARIAVSSGTGAGAFTTSASSTTHIN